MNTNDLRDEISHKLNPSMFRQIFSGPSDECIPGRINKFIDEIPEVEDDDSYGDEDEDDED